MSFLLPDDLGDASLPVVSPGPTACFSLCNAPRPDRVRRFACAGGFTLIEVLVTLGAIAVVVGLLAPALHSARHAAREAAGAANLREIGSATTEYMSDHRNELPQVRITPNGELTRDPSALYLPWLFGGGRSIVNVFEAARIGADRRPLNEYLGDFRADDSPDVFLDPLDAGTDDNQLIGFAPGRHDARVFDLIGTSYVLNDHALDLVPCPFVEIFDTLIPQGGGSMPVLDSPARTWLAGQSPIYNYDDGHDKGEVWGRDRVRASLYFADGHAEVALPVAVGAVNTTEDYTFFPQHDWAERFVHLADFAD